ncbi:MAG: dienelactone hydrolase family protein [Candidatus Eremiobacteraeota bacterium]|nr:dienelactone hydrolase family protein [Candidatus Eremiobacteraeota bacterium]
MTIVTGFEYFPAGTGVVRCYVARPQSESAVPGIVAFSDIFQLTPSTRRAIDRIAGYGFIVVAPEIYHRLEPSATELAFDDAGRDRGMADAKRTTVAEFDADARALVMALGTDARVDASRIGAVGWCLGGHLAFRAALLPEVRATVCFYPTGLQNGELGADADAGSLARAAEVRGALLVIFGERDPHVPAAGREAVAAALQRAGVRHSVEIYDAEHAFMRDQGPRYDPERTDRAFARAAAFYREILGAQEIR